MSQARHMQHTHRFRFPCDRNASECYPCCHRDCRSRHFVLQRNCEISIERFVFSRLSFFKHRLPVFNVSLTRIPMLTAVNTVIAVAMSGMIGMIAGVLRPASGRAYSTRPRPNGGVVIRVEIAGRQSDARYMLTSVRRELIGRPNSCTTVQPSNRTKNSEIQ